jgi:micrococcal nuclease
VIVTHITDGDTFRAGDERIRLIGIDTPEVAQGPECFGEEATAALERLVPVGTEVRLVTDVEPTDLYDRTLAYVHRASDDVDVGRALLAEGVARVLEVPPNTTRAATYAAESAAARAEGRGLWSACPATAGSDSAASDPAPPVAPTPTSSTTVPSTPTSTPPASTAGGGCDPAYPDVCIPPAPPDLDCADVPFRRLRVLAPDPHRFDGGGDGIGCEAG